MILREALASRGRLLREAGIEGPERDARILLAEALGMAPSRLTLEADLKVTEAQVMTFDGFIARRIAREPVSKILGRRQFWGRDFKVTKDVLDPRPETESLIDLCLQFPAPDRLLDLGCGSGAIALTLLAEWPSTKALAVDISEAALKVAQENADAIGVSARLNLKKSNWYSDVEGGFDLIVSNPPYITGTEMGQLSQEVFRHDPHIALTPGGDGLAPYTEIAKGAAKHLTSNGRLLVEIGWKQGQDVCQIFNSFGLRDVSCHKDLNVHDRVVSARNS